jgi:aminoglycoside phosphotransferase (APT) family kinase protein
VPPALGPIAANNPIDTARLGRYLQARLPAFGGEFTVLQFQAGQSNPTYRLATADATYVLRKKPAGTLLPSAHQVDREYKVMAALHGIVPVPRMLHLCTDETVIGQSFYVMEYVDGRLLSDARMLEAARGERPALCLELVNVLARLHSADYTALGLGDFGRPQGYLSRQLARWTKQYAASRLEDNADMNRVIPWLEENIPPNDAAAIVHGDYRSYNVIFARQEPRLLAVLDWELATIGHPLADLAYLCLPYYLQADDLRGFHGERPDTLNIPTEGELLAEYCRATGRSELPDWRYYLVFSLFRSAAIRAGVFKRAHDGTAASPQALEAGSRYRGAAQTAWRLVHSGAAI